MKVLILDNYDSFTYNLLHLVEQLVEDVSVIRNDAISLEETEAYTHFIISPGPGLPKQAGITMALIEKYHQTRPIFGVCLGCQAIAEFFGATLYNQVQVAHGLKRTVVKTEKSSQLLKDQKSSFEVGLYHSWAIDESKLSKDLKVTARGLNNVAMAVEHNYLPMAGVQFHPESIMTENGISILKNWLVELPKIHHQ